MTFVNELIPEEQKDKFDPEVFKLNLAYPPMRPYRWTIDREREIFLIKVGAHGYGGGQGDGFIPPVFYTLSWKGQVIKFDVRIWSTGKFIDGDLDLNWEIFNIKLPPSLENKQAEVFELIQEAIRAIDTPSGLSKDKYRSINTVFI